MHRNIISCNQFQTLICCPIFRSTSQFIQSLNAHNSFLYSLKRFLYKHNCDAKIISISMMPSLYWSLLNSTTTKLYLSQKKCIPKKVLQVSFILKIMHVFRQDWHCTITNDELVLVQKIKKKLCNLYCYYFWTAFSDCRISTKSETNFIMLQPSTENSVVLV